MSIRLDHDSFDLQGECPVCRSSDLNYGKPDITDDCLSYDWTCNHCGSKGVERYTIDFYSQHLDYDGLQKMKTNDPDREWEPKTHV